MSTKVHTATDALGHSVRLLFGPGPRHDVTRSHELVDGFEPDAVIADKGYDAGHFRKAVYDAGAEAVIPSRSNRKAPHDYDRMMSPASAWRRSWIRRSPAGASCAN